MINFFLGVFVGVVGTMMFGLVSTLRDEDGYEEWCGCDGVGMAHTPGAKGFACADTPAKEG